MRGQGKARFLGLISAATLALGVIVPLQLNSAASPAEAVNAGQWNPGLIISDAQFYDGGAMSSNDIQVFLQSKVGACGNANCLRNAVVSPPSYAASYSSSTGNLICNAITGGTMLVSEWIYRAQVACGISAKVILVTLEKEQGLVSNSAPSDGRLRAAMGMACPDTAPCDSAYAGLATQIYFGAKQLKIYKAANFSRQPGTYSIQWSPNAACGSSVVTVQNYGTAALYDYTPYQPNPAALANLYGTGDACSSYGNRNFWRIYWDWFGDPTLTATFVRTANDATIWLLTQGTRYGVPSQDILSLYSPLGGVQYVSDAYVQNFTAGPNLGYLVRNQANSAIYLFDGKLHFVSACSQLPDYLQSCNSFADLMPSQIGKLPFGDDLTSYADVDGISGVYRIQGGTKTWMTPAQAAAANGGTAPASTTLTSAYLATIPDAPSTVAVGSVLRSTAGAIYLVDSATRLVPMSAAVAAELTVATPMTVPDSVITQFTTKSDPLLLTATCGGTNVIVTPGGLTPGPTGGVKAVDLSTALCGATTVKPAMLSSALYVRSTDTGGFYLVRNGAKSALSAAIAASLGVTAATAVDETQAVLDGLPTAPAVIAPGTLARTTSDPTVYLIDGVGQRVPIDSFTVTSELGFGSGAVVLADGALNGYPVASAALSLVVQCDGVLYLGSGGQRWKIGGGDPGLPVTTLAASTCTTSPVAASTASGPVLLVRSATNGLVYAVTGGQRHLVPTQAALDALGDGASPTWVSLSDAALARIPSGTALSDPSNGTSPAFATPVDVYRFWSADAQSHFYTMSTSERDQIIATYPTHVWSYEGTAFQAFAVQAAGTVPLYRFWSSTTQSHFYTSDPDERDYLIAHYPTNVWQYEGVAFYVYPIGYAGADASPVYRFWSALNQQHFYTADANEAQYIKTHYPTNVWQYEQIAFMIPK